jgi:DNA-binding beta-propeller fold protein YncE
MIFYLILIFLGMPNPVSAQAADTSLQSTAVSIPGGEGGIGFDDMAYSPDLHKVLVPAGHTGKIYLIDPVNFTMDSIGGFSSSPEFQKGHEVGVSSADQGEGFIFAADHGKHQIIAVDAKTGAVAASADLLGDADYVRFVGINHEVWVTEPHDKRIEIFRFSAADHSIIRTTIMMFVNDGPESLMIDTLRGRAYTNLGPQAAALDLSMHSVIGKWPNDCIKSRGDALDSQKGYLFVSCAEGKAVVFDLNHDNKEISTLSTDPGPDVISYNAKLSHLYFTSSKNATLSILGVSAQGKLSLLGQAPADKRAHCVVSDDQDNIWVCDPPRGQLLRYKDSL